MAKVEADVDNDVISDEITFEQDIFYAAVKVEPDVSEPSPPSFAYVRVKDEPLDYDDLATLKMNEGVFSSNNPDDDAVDPLLLDDLKTEIKQEPNTSATTYHHLKTVGVCPMPGNSLEVKNEEIQEPTISPGVTGKVPTDRVLRSIARSFNCSVCDKQFKSDAILQQNLVTHSNEKSLCCVKCKKKFSSQSYPQIHLKLRAKDKLCTECHEESRSGLLPNHVAPMDSDDKTLSCQQCKKMFKTKYGLQRHMLVHFTDRPYACDQCDRKFKAAYRFTNHMMRRHLVFVPLSCNLCKKTFSTGFALKRHMMCHSFAGSSSCSHCPTTCKTEGKLNIHLLSHSKATPYSCTQCEKKFKTKQLLDSHMMVHTDERPFACTQCKWTFKRKSNLSTHMLTHSTEAPYTCVFMTDCGECLSKFRAKHKLREHMARHLQRLLQMPLNQATRHSKLCTFNYNKCVSHLKDPVFMCSVCAAIFKSKKQLNVHMAKHSRRKAYACSLCPALFKHYSSRSRHVKSHKN